jgi:hypothetical protein
MTKDEIQQIKAFVENKPMFDAVCKVLQEEEVFAHDVKDQDDAAYGREVRAWVKARSIISERIVKLVRLSSTNPQPASTNQAR